MTKRILLLLVVLLNVNSIWAQKSVDDPKHSYNYHRGAEAYNNGMYKDAMDFFDADLRDNPKNGYAYLYQSDIYYNHGFYGDALDKANLALKFLPKKDKEARAAILAGRACIYAALQDTVNALLDYENAMMLSCDMSFITAHMNLLNELGRYEQQGPDARRLMLLYPNNAQARVYIGRYYVNLKNYTEALRQYDLAARLDASYASAYSFRAEAYIDLQQWREAAEDVATALAIDTDDKAWLEMQAIASKSFDHMATSLLSRHIKEPDNAIWSAALATIYSNANRYAEAEPYFTESIKVLGYGDTSAAEMYFRRANNRKALNRWADAIDDVNTAIAEDSTIGKYYYLRSQLYFLAGKPDLAVDDATKTIRIFPDDPLAYTNRGRIRLLAGAPRNAIDDFTTALTLAPDNADALINRAMAYRALGGREQEAKADLHHLATIDDEYNYNKINAYAHLGEGDKMMPLWKEYESILEPEDFNEVFYYYKATINSLLGNIDEALKAFEEAIVFGDRRFYYFQHDPELANLRQDKRFEALIAKYQEEEKPVIDLTDPSQVTTTEIPFTRESGICKVKCTINELPLSFYFDTGASSVTLSNVEAAFMLKNGYLTTSDIKGSTYFSDANGDISEGTVVILRKVEFAGLTLENVKASIVHNQKAPLLLGQSVLSRLGKIEIDNAGNILKITHKK